jgi:hypothetical protein
MFKDESNFKLFEEDSPETVEDPILPGDAYEEEGEAEDDPEKGGLDEEETDDPAEIGGEEMESDATDTGRDE